MNVNFLYNLLASFTFSITFDVDSQESQNYFLFHGDNSTAHLFRDDNVLKLIVESKSGFRHYESRDIATQFTFTWDGFKIDGGEMQIVRSSGNISDLDFNGYTFLSPSLDVNQGPEYNQEQPLRAFFTKTNYGLLALIVLGVGLLLRSDAIAPKFWEVLLKLCMQSVVESLPVEEDPYTTMV